jgi:hypothetical protein
MKPWAPTELLKEQVTFPLKFAVWTWMYAHELFVQVPPWQAAPPPPPHFAPCDTVTVVGGGGAAGVLCDAELEIEARPGSETVTLIVSVALYPMVSLPLQLH